MKTPEIKAGFVHGHGMVERWNKKNVVDWILACRRQGGFPMFVTRFGGMRWKFDHEPAVLAKCWVGKGPEISTYFVGVPKEDEKLIEESSQDWVKIMKKYAPEKLREAEKYPLIIKNGRFPKVVFE